MSRTPRVEPRPFLKWVGGKRQLLPEILRRLPAEIDHYVEPFLGGGAVFFALAAEGRIRKGAHLSDANEELVATYRAVRDDVEGVIAVLARYGNTREAFEWARAIDWRSTGSRAPASPCSSRRTTGCPSGHRTTPLAEALLGAIRGPLGRRGPSPSLLGEGRGAWPDLR